MHESLIVYYKAGRKRVGRRNGPLGKKIRIAIKQNTTICSCTKIAYPSRSAAYRALKAVSKGDPKAHQLGVYECPGSEPGTWHVGHDAFRPGPAVVKKVVI